MDFFLSSVSLKKGSFVSSRLKPRVCRWPRHYSLASPLQCVPCHYNLSLASPLVRFRRCRDEAVVGLEQGDAVTPHHHHADAVLLARLAVLHGLVNHQVHEGVKATQDAGDGPVAVELDGHLMIHVTLE